MIRAFVFDFGRVISAQKPRSLFRRYEEELGLAPDTINRIMFESEAWDEAQKGLRSAEAFWREIGPRLNLRTQEKIDAFRRRYHADEAVNPEVVDLIRRLHGEYRLAVLSNSPPGLARWLRDWDLLDLFDVVFCSGDEGVTKPDARSYAITLERLGVTPGEAVFVDDTPGHVEAARRLGLKGVVFTDAGRLEEDLGEWLGRPACRPAAGQLGR